ncbi:N-acetyltransferase [Chitiniphilus shinanonensis]|uniref:N-acetyltransferase n=1 Tax=Chitiniphilus shinanonensis TaxID=553088 RepID=A0ABQ6BX03_9NEIS|nr:GNAT family N-acetyltransferase [Chitiniphilus shinanonensis]GLS06239.1 N-acetyltransferase [Chitiniphilus shinanonensis]
MNPTPPRLATPGDLDALAALFDQYRQFYGRPADPALARDFVALRLELRDSRLFVVDGAQGLAGFAQAYPSLSSLAAGPIWILNDIFVAPTERGRHVGTRLLQGVEVAARSAGVLQLRVETAPDNVGAQRLYQSQGFRREMGFLQFVLKL